MSTDRKRWAFVILGLFLAAVLAACGGGANDTMTVLAGSELRDIEPLLDQVERETGVALQMEYIGTLNGAEQLLSGTEVDLAWFSHGTYLTLLQGDQRLIETQEKIMLSPVVMGVKESVARRFGWVDNPEVTWQDVATRAAAGELRYAMTNPTASNSGFTALVGVASALSGGGDALDSGEVNQAGLEEFFSGQALTAGSSGWLAEAYVADQDALDGMVNYESVLLSLNESGELREPLVLIYPKEGIITADYPLMLLNPDKREAYDRLVAYLRSADFQEELMRTTLRRPVVPGVPLDARIPDPLLVELPFPSNLDTIDALLFSFLDETRAPPHAFFVLDVSGSMEGERISDLKAAMDNLTGLDQTLTGRFSRFRARELITIIPFSTDVEDIADFTVEDVAVNSADMAQVREYVSRLQAGGDTAIYSALATAYDLAAQAKAADPDRYYSVVLMTDGELTAGIQPDAFERFHRSLPPEARDIPTFTVLFGGANRDEMEAIARLTGGRMFDAQTDALSLVFKEIRGYQ